MVDVDQREHGESADKRARLDGDAAPQQGFVTGFVKQSADDHLQIGEDASENNPRDDLQGAQKGSNWEMGGQKRAELKNVLKCFDLEIVPL